MGIQISQNSEPDTKEIINWGILLRQPKKVQEKTLEQMIVNHRKDLLRKNLCSKKIKRNKRQTDDVSVISSGRSCVSTSSNVARALRMRIPKLNPKHDDAFANRPDLTHILYFSPPVPIAAPSTQPDTAGPSATHSTPSAEQHTTILRKDKRTITMSDTSDSDDSSVRRNKRQLKKQKKSSKSSAIVENIQITEVYSAEITISDTNYIGEVSVDPNTSLLREMTALEAEERSD